MSTTYLFQLQGSKTLELTLVKDRPHGLEDSWKKTMGEDCLIVSDGFVVSKSDRLVCEDGNDHQNIVDLIGASWESYPGDTGTANAANTPG